LSVSTDELDKKRKDREAWLEKRKAELPNEVLEVVDQKGVMHTLKPKKIVDVRDADGVVIGVVVEWEEFAPQTA